MREFETNLANIVRPLSQQKFLNYLGMVVHACSPSYLGGWAGELLEPRRQRLQ